MVTCTIHKARMEIDEREWRQGLIVLPQCELPLSLLYGPENDDGDSE